MKWVVISLIYIFTSQFLFGEIINIPEDYTTIQAGIDSAQEGDTVLVDRGIYVENIDLDGKNITVASLYLTTQDTSYISYRIINGNQDGTVVTIHNVEDTLAVLCGFTITNGLSEYGGGICIYCPDGGVNILNNRIVYNKVMSNSYAYGGGIDISGGMNIKLGS